jgi:hypothetical protein
MNRSKKKFYNPEHFTPALLHDRDRLVASRIRVKIAKDSMTSLFHPSNDNLHNRMTNTAVFGLCFLKTSAMVGVLKINRTGHNPSSCSTE